MTPDEYFAAVANVQKANPAWRYGQSCFNVLLLHRPELAERIRGTDADPFHARSDSDPRMQRFYRFVDEEWGTG